MSPPQPEPVYAPARERREVPPYVEWWDWYVAKARTLTQGMHMLFVGPTQSGKTTLCRYVAALRNYNVVLGTKPKDSSLDAYVDEGYHRIDHWPPTKEDYRKGADYWPAGKVWFILWPKIRTRAELRSYRQVYVSCIEDVFVDGGWTVVADEGIWLGSRDGLNVGSELADLAYGSASNKVSLYLLLQRPSGVPRIIWSSVAGAMIFHGGVTADVRELASLGTYPPRDVQRAIQALQGHEFLDLPTRGGAAWAVSEVAM